MVRLEELNPEQRAAASHIDGPLLILAGAGSGKTRTLVYRIAYMLERGINPTNILAVSFTNKAVREMEERVAAMISSPELARKMTLSTFHSLGVKMLRRDITKLGYPKKFTIFDPGDQLAMVRRVMREKTIDEKVFEPKEMLADISMAKNKLLDPQDTHPLVLREIYQAYQNGLRASGAVDFDDLFYLPVRLLREFPEVKRHWSQRFKYIMIDEYQDTNYVQLTLVRELAEEHKNLCVVGDDDQSIYGWRGSDVENIRQFHRHFDGTKVVKLTQNYRCSGNILKAANVVIGKGKDRFAKELWTSSGDGPQLGMVVTEDEAEEAQFVVENLHALCFSEQRKWSDAAILYRTNAQARIFEEMLRNERIPYRLIGGQKFYERKEIRDMLAYFRVIYQAEDEIALRRILNYPSRGIGVTTVNKLTAYAQEHGLSFYETCKNASVLPTLAPAARKAVGKFVEMIQKYRHRTQDELMSSWVPDLLEDINIHNTLYREYPKLSEATRRLEHLEVLQRSITSYESRAQDPTLEDFLERVCLDTNNDDDKDETDENAVTLMTLHSAKGLEFPVVYLVGMEEGLMPFVRNPTDGCDLEEERRLCYVGITRAKNHLFLTRAESRNRYGKRLERTPSRFLDDIPEDVIKWMGKADAGNTSTTEEEKEEKFTNFFSSLKAGLAATAANKKEGL
jgi:superfamily I DNA/RNA helicase